MVTLMHNVKMESNHHNFDHILFIYVKASLYNDLSLQKNSKFVFEKRKKKLILPKYALYLCVCALLVIHISIP